jgi:hypothetical protein
MTWAENPVAMNDVGQDVVRPARLSSPLGGISKARNSLPASQMLSNSSRVFRDVAGYCLVSQRDAAEDLWLA